MASNHNKEASMSVMNHRFGGLGFEGLLNVNAVITIKRLCKDKRKDSCRVVWFSKLKLMFFPVFELMSNVWCTLLMS